MRKFKLKGILCMMLLMVSVSINAGTEKNIRISTDNTDLILRVAPNGRLYQVYYGERLKSSADVDNFRWNVPRPSSDGSVTTRGWEVCSCSGNEEYFEPSLAITHNDGNRTTYLYYVSDEQKPVNGGNETIIRLKDDKYPVSVVLHYIAYSKENVIKTWSEVSHQEKNPLTLWRYASTMLYFNAEKYFLIEYHSDWAKEGQPATQQLQFGVKSIETKLGARAAMHAEPFFELGINEPARENGGEAVLGTVGWTGNFKLLFEIDNVGNLRVIPGINSYASDYLLPKGEVFTTPEFIFSRSSHGTGEASRNIQDWARLYQIKNGMGDRMTLLNNWENTYFDFNQEKLSSLMKDGKELGVDLFLLDDGWFGNKYPRKDDHAGLGDWQETRTKLPGGIPALVNAAKDAGVKFGIWIEPEMVNPKSELFERHPDWVIHLPNRETYYYRNQLVLDLTNPKVQDYVYDVIGHIMKSNPNVSYFKWDCNSPITNIYSPYLSQKQGNLYIDYVRGLYNVMRRVKQNYPDLPLMLCSGGGARCDYEALKYFTEFWCSDDTDPYERLYIQYSLSKFFPAKAMCAHVTDWNRNTSVKFRTDVASMCKLGFDIDLKKLSKDELSFVQQAVKNWNALKPAILEGSMYRLISPYESNHAAFNYVSQDKQLAVLFGYDLHPRFSSRLPMVKLQGLDADKQYKVEEINLMSGQKSDVYFNGKTFSGDYLMKVGLDILSSNEARSHVFSLIAF